MGGPITDGTYVMVAYKRYTGMNGASGPTGTKAAFSQRFVGPSYWFAAHIVPPGGPEKLDAESGSVSTDGMHTVHRNPTCPLGSAAYDNPYTAAGDMLYIYGDTGGGIMGEVTYARVGP